MPRLQVPWRILHGNPLIDFYVNPKEDVVPGHTLLNVDMNDTAAVIETAMEVFQILHE